MDVSIKEYINPFGTESGKFRDNIIMVSGAVDPCATRARLTKS